MSRSRVPVMARLLLLLAFPAFASTTPARALDEQAGEKKAIDACDKRLCTMLQQKTLTGEDLKCALSKTWTKSTLKQGDQRDVQWMFGDARCSVHIDISREKIIGAVTGKQVKFWVPPHTANCLVEQDGQVKTVTATVAPKIVFKDGRAEKIWINLLQVDGPTAIKATLVTAAQLNDTIGLFHRAMLKSVNGYIHKHCPRDYPLTHATTAAAPKPAAAKPAKPAAPAAPKKEGG